MFRFTIVLLMFGGIYCDAEELSCEVSATTEAGVVCGAIKLATNGAEFASFQGIPYAKAPEGKYRFAEPRNPDPFVGKLDATLPGPVCPQAKTIFSVAMSPKSMGEDCLRINVYTPIDFLPDPNLTNCSKSLAPVLVFIHGGSFVYGSGDPDVYGPEHLISKGIVIVTFNYRLHSIGFLSLDSDEIPGNAGLRDVFYALKWVQSNIRNFGGDPEEVTLGGHSAGAMLTHLISISPAVKGSGLFKKVMALSGSGLSNAFTTSPVFAKIVAKTFLIGMGISSSLSKEAIHRELINAPIEKILEANKFVESTIGLPVIFSPVVETPRTACTTMIPEDPEILIKEGYGKEYVILTGFTNNECYLYETLLRQSNYETKLRLLPYLTIPQNLLYISKYTKLPLLTAELSREYFNKTLASLDKYMNLCNDVVYKYPAMRIAQQRLDTGAEPTFIYQFGYKGPISLIQNMFKTNYTGAGHIEDLTFVFKFNSLLDLQKLVQLDDPNHNSTMKDAMTNLVANFVKTGKPTLDPTQWRPYGKDHYFLNIEAHPIDYECKPATPYMMDKKKFFDKLYNIGRGHGAKGNYVNNYLKRVLGS